MAGIPDVGMDNLDPDTQVDWGDDDDGAGAEGGATGGDSAGDTALPPPLQPPEDIDRTNPFEPTGGTSTPYPPPDDGGEAIEMAHMPLDEEEFDGDDIPLFTDFTSADEKKTVLDRARRFIKDKFPNVDFHKLGPIGFSKTPGNEDTIVRFGPKGGEEAVFKKNSTEFLKSFIDRFQTSLGQRAEDLIAKKNQEERELRQSLAEEEKELKEKEQLTALEQKKNRECAKPKKAN